MAERTLFTLEDIENLHWFTRNTSIQDTDEEVLQQFSAYINSKLRIIDQLVEQENKKEQHLLNQYTLLNNRFHEVKHRYQRSRISAQYSFWQNYSTQLIILNHIICLIRDVYNEQYNRVDRMMTMLTDIANFFQKMDEIIPKAKGEYDRSTQNSNWKDYYNFNVLSVLFRATNQVIQIEISRKALSLSRWYMSKYLWWNRNDENLNFGIKCFNSTSPP